MSFAVIESSSSGKQLGGAKRPKKPRRTTQPNVQHAVRPLPVSKLSESVESFCAEWKEIQRKTCDAQVKLLREFFEAQRQNIETMREVSSVKRNPDMGSEMMDTLKSAGMAPPSDDQATIDAASSSRAVLNGAHQLVVAPASLDGVNPIAVDAGKPIQKAEGGAPPVVGKLEAFKEEFRDLRADDEAIEWWKRSSGSHTVEDWLGNYCEHPGGWGALLMIHGIPEVTGRLRSKVESYAMYSALFLSVSIGMIASPPSHMVAECVQDGLAFWECEVQKRMYVYLLEVGTAAHMLSILLSIAFINVLNEAARDSDVIRMFARGKAFLATVKCQKAFIVGCLTDVAALVVAAKACIGWDVVGLAVCLAVMVSVVLRETSILLFQNASIVEYWRVELGGKPDADDPYDLAVPVLAAQRRSNAARRAMSFAAGA